MLPTSRSGTALFATAAAIATASALLFAAAVAVAVGAGGGVIDPPRRRRSRSEDEDEDEDETQEGVYCDGRRVPGGGRVDADADGGDDERRRRREREEDQHHHPDVRSISIDADRPGGGEEDESSSVPGRSGRGRRRVCSPGTVTVAYASTTGTCRSMAQSLRDSLVALPWAAGEDGDDDDGDDARGTGGTGDGGERMYTVQVGTVDSFDWWDEFLNDDDDEAATSSASSQHGAPPPVLIVVIPTWTGGTAPPDAVSLSTHLSEILTDWRVEPHPLRKRGLRAAAFGMGSSAYDTDTFCRPAREIYGKLVGDAGAVPLCRGGGKGRVGVGGVVGTGDDAAGDAKAEFDAWVAGRVLPGFAAILGRRPGGVEAGGETKAGDCGEVGTENQATTTTTTKKKTKKKRVVIKGRKPARQKGAKNGTKNGRGNDRNTNGGTSSSNGGDGGGCCQDDDGADADGGVANGTAGGGCACKEEEKKEKDDSNFREDEYPSSDDEGDDGGGGRGEPEVMDLEDLGGAMANENYDDGDDGENEPKEMVTPRQAASLKKEGYKLIGTHSAVKLCRWTKHQLRGRGGCYKHTFYGITSYQCMEATPSLACANKCVFCWRHHKNPVGKEWRWKTDDPHYIVDEAVRAHQGMIREARGIPGVLPERYREALTPRHCALSLVGEPIMYPRINDLLGDLHGRAISTFLVTNGQHPRAIGDLVPVTQLYVSVDAPTPESLVEIDRPLFSDAWERLRTSLSCLRDRGQRTVARLTVVKGWNSDEIGGYAELIALGRCSLVEVKGVTFCGKSDASNLNMSNTPWHHEVVELTRNLQKELAKLTAAGGDGAPPEYGLACEHRHSCSVLLARVDQFAVDDPETGTRRWRTWIDYDRFHELAKRHASDPGFTFEVRDYVADTPEWALFGAREEGFDPTDTRHRRKQKHPKYTKFDERGVPTHDHNEQPIEGSEIERLGRLMEEKTASVGGASVQELKGGEKTVIDASLMFRGMVVAK